MNLPGRLQLEDSAYRFQRQSGRATFAGTYDGRPVFVKRNNGEQLRREEAVLRATAGCPGIPNIVDYIEQNGQDLLVMERLPGVPLAHYIELGREWHSKRLPLKETIRIVDGLAACFEALHSAGYLYRDLNLEHIIVDPAHIGLVDHEWCVTADAAGWGRVDSRAGTWETMAHEEFFVGNRITRMSNTYTLGVVLLQLLQGSNPFFVSSSEVSNTELQRVRARELHQQLPLLQTTHAGVADMLHTALQPTPSKRYSSVAVFRKALAALQ